MILNGESLTLSQGVYLRLGETQIYLDDTVTLPAGQVMVVVPRLAEPVTSLTVREIDAIEDLEVHKFLHCPEYSRPTDTGCGLAQALKEFLGREGLTLLAQRDKLLDHGLALHCIAFAELLEGRDNSL